MSYEIRKQNGCSVVYLAGDVDLSCSAVARKQILECLYAGEDTLVDLSNVEYIDSSGIASLVEGFQMAKKKNVKFALLGLSDAAMSVLELARLDKVFPIHRDIDAYLQAQV